MIQRKKGAITLKRTKGDRACAAGHPLNYMKAGFLRLITALFNPFHSLRSVVKRPQRQLGTFGSGKRLTTFQKEITARFHRRRNTRTSHKGNYRAVTSTGNTGYLSRTRGKLVLPVRLVIYIRGSGFHHGHRFFQSVGTPVNGDIIPFADLGECKFVRIRFFGTGIRKG